MTGCHSPWKWTLTSKRGARGAPFASLLDRRALGRGARRLGRRRRGLRRRRRRVLELLLGPEERVEDLLAEALRQRQGEARPNEQDHEAAAPPALALASRSAQRLGRVTQ